MTAEDKINEILAHEGIRFPGNVTGVTNTSKYPPVFNKVWRKAQRELLEEIYTELQIKAKQNLNNNVTNWDIEIIFNRRLKELEE